MEGKGMPGKGMWAKEYETEFFLAAVSLVMADRVLGLHLIQYLIPLPGIPLPVVETRSLGVRSMIVAIAKTNPGSGQGWNAKECRQRNMRLNSALLLSLS